MWVQGDLYRSQQKQQQLRQSRQQERNMSRLISSMDDISIDSASLKPQSVNEVRHLRCHPDVHHNLYLSSLYNKALLALTASLLVIIKILSIFEDNIIVYK